MLRKLGEIVAPVITTELDLMTHASQPAAEQPAGGLRRGIVGDLVRAALDWATRQGLVKVALCVFPDNELAIAVYESQPWQRG